MPSLHLPIVHAGAPLPAEKRRKLMDSPAFTRDLVLGTEHVYTFVGWFHHMNWARFEVDLAGFLAFDLSRCVTGDMGVWCVLRADLELPCYNKQPRARVLLRAKHVLVL